MFNPIKKYYHRREWNVDFIKKIICKKFICTFINIHLNIMLKQMVNGKVRRPTWTKSEMQVPNGRVLK
jgi:hypothetical protein